MAAHRFFLVDRLVSDGPSILPLSPDDLHHARDVARIGAGEEIEAIEPDGRAWRAKALRWEDAGLLAEPLCLLDSRPTPPIVLVQGVAKGEKMDAIVRQAIEIGATEIVPVVTSRSVVRIAPDKRAAKAERWRRVAKAAAEQSHRSFVPVVHDPIALEDFVPTLARFDAVFILWEECTGPGLAAAVSSGGLAESARIALVIGPEGGLSGEEVGWLTQVGAVPVTVGPHILRTETAAIVALSLALHARGGLGGSDD